MIHKGKKVLGLPVRIRGLKEGETVGTIDKIIVDPKQRRLHALILKRANIFKSYKFILFDAVISIDDESAEIGTAAQIMNLKEDDYTLKIFDERITVLGQRVVTEANRYLGDVIEFHFDINTGQIVDLIVEIKGLPGRADNEERQIPIDEIVAFYKESLIVKDPEVREHLKVLTTAKEKILLDARTQDIRQRKTN